MTIFLRRTSHFSAGLLNGQGHDYRVDMTVGGKIDQTTGMVVNIKDIDALLKAAVVGALNGRVLDRDVPQLLGREACCEALVQLIWNLCLPGLPPTCELLQVTLQQDQTLRETMSRLDIKYSPKISDLPMVTLTRTYDFSASHRLHAQEMTAEQNLEIFGKCNWPNGHGHNYEIEVTVAGAVDTTTGRIIDPLLLDRVVEDEVLAPFDHRHLNYDVSEFSRLNPTSENLTKVIWDRVVRREKELGAAKVVRVAVRETARNYFEYFGE